MRNTNRYHRPPDETEEEFTALLLDDLDEAIVQAGPETVAMVIFEPVQNAGGSFTPPAGYFQGVREICDRYGILLCADEVITGFGRLGDWFGSSKYDIRPDLITCAKGLSSSYAAIGAVLVADSVYDAFDSETAMYAHGITFGGHPVVERRRAQEPRDHAARAHRRAASRSTRRPSARSSRRCSTSTSSATCAARATSGRSSS